MGCLKRAITTPANSATWRMMRLMRGQAGRHPMRMALSECTPGMARPLLFAAGAVQNATATYSTMRLAQATQVRAGAALMASVIPGALRTAWWRRPFENAHQRAGHNHMARWV